jgi:protein-tyrosine phosphatase
MLATIRGQTPHGCPHRGIVDPSRLLSLSLSLMLFAACTPPPPTPLPADEPIAEREGETLVVRWERAPTSEPLDIFAGPGPDRIDRKKPVGRLVDGRAEIREMPFPGRPYLEVALPGGRRLSLAERQLPLEGSDNFRDLGGYPTRDGRRTRWGTLYRSGQLSELTDADLDYLSDLGIALVCDFRSPQEREAEPDRLPTDPAPAVRELEIYTPGVDPSGLRDRIMSDDLEGLDLGGFLVEANRAFVTEFAPRYRTMFEAVLAGGNLPMVVHCTAGKDRAGVAAALLLLSVGVSEQTVLQDFLLTNHYTAQRVEETLLGIRILSLFRTDPEEVRPLLLVEPRYLEAAFESMRAQDGSIEDYLGTTLGLSSEDRARLRELLLEPLPEGRDEAR